VLTVAVSVSAGVDNIISAFTGLADVRVPLALLFVAFLTAMNLRGVKESGRVFAVPTYGFLLGIGAWSCTGCSGPSPATPRRPRARLRDPPEEGKDELAGLALAFLALRAFASGARRSPASRPSPTACPAFRKPKSRTPRRPSPSWAASP
jgi:hypothetical protein